MKQHPKELTVRITRAFAMGGEPVPADTVIVLDAPFALELIGMNKAVLTNEAPRAPRAAEEAPAKSAGKGKRASKPKGDEQAASNDNQAPQGDAEQQE